MKFLLNFLFMALSALPLFSQTSIWQVEGNGTTLYIGGTVHVLSKADYPLPKEYDEVYSKAEELVFEADIAAMSDPTLAGQIMMSSMYTDDRTLSSVLNEESYSKLSKECKKAGIDIKKMEKLKPSMVILTLTMMSLQDMGIGEEGVDQKFYSKAKEDGKDLDFFETVKEQVNMITSMGEGNESEYVLHSLNDLKDTEDMMTEILADWKKGTSGIINETLDEMKKDYPNIYKTLVLDRNNAWMPKIDSFLEDKDVEFILVGTLHLHGSDGLITQLKNKGYNVVQYQAP